MWNYAFDPYAQSSTPDGPHKYQTLAACYSTPCELQTDHNTQYPPTTHRAILCHSIATRCRKLPSTSLRFTYLPLLHHLRIPLLRLPISTDQSATPIASYNGYQIREMSSKSEILVPWPKIGIALKYLYYITKMLVSHGCSSFFFFFFLVRRKNGEIFYSDEWLGKHPYLFRLEHERDHLSTC